MMPLMPTRLTPPPRRPVRWVPIKDEPDHTCGQPLCVLHVEHGVVRTYPPIVGVVRRIA